MWYTSTAVSTGSLVRQLPTAYHRKQRFFLRRYITGEFCYTTLPTTNMAPENRPSQKETNLPKPYFSGAMPVLVRVYSLWLYCVYKS